MYVEYPLLEKATCLSSPRSIVTFTAVSTVKVQEWEQRPAALNYLSCLQSFLMEYKRNPLNILKNYDGVSKIHPS